MKYRQWRALSFFKTTEPNHLSPRCFSALTWVYFYFIFSFCSNLHPPLSLSWRTLVYRKKHSWARDNSVATM